MSEWVRGRVRGSVTLYLVDTIATTVLINHFQTSLVSCGWSKTTLALCVQDLVDTIPTTDLA